MKCLTFQHALKIVIGYFLHKLKHLHGRYWWKSLSMGPVPILYQYKLLKTHRYASSFQNNQQTSSSCFWEINRKQICSFPDNWHSLKSKTLVFKNPFLWTLWMIIGTVFSIISSLKQKKNHFSGMFTLQKKKLYWDSRSP